MCRNQDILLGSLLLLGSLSFFGCAQKEPQATVSLAQPIESRLEWSLPDGWEVRWTGDGARYASWATPNGTEVIITRFPGHLGSDLANINRWRGQLGLLETDEGVMELIETKANPARFAVVTSPETTKAIAGAMLEVEGSTFAFKVLDEKSKVEAILPDFRQAIASLHYTGHNH